MALLRPATLLALLVFVLYNLNFRVVNDGGDSVSARLLPFNVLRTHGAALDADPAIAELATAVPPGKPYVVPYWLWQARGGGPRYTAYPIVTPLLITPLYVPAYAYVRWRGWETWRLETTALRMEKLVASSIAALSVGLFFCLVRPRLSAGRAVVLTLAFGLGTLTWAISSQSLWQHGMGELLAVVALLSVLPAGDATADGDSAGGLAVPRLAAAGCAAGLLAVNRPPDALLAAAILGYLALRCRGRATWALGAAFVAAAPFLSYNWTVFHHLVGGYGVTGAANYAYYLSPFLEGFAGQLVSPGKGLLVFSPFLLFLGYRLVPGWGTKTGYALLDGCVAAGIAAQLVLYSVVDWRAGACYGGRYLSDCLPFVVWLLVPVVGRLSGWPWRLFVAAAGVAVVVEGIGAFCYPRGHSDDIYYPAEVSRGTITPGVWSPGDAPFLVEAAAGVAPPELLPHRHAGPGS